jgi:pyruvate/2-oxoglutarate dehydrogenase complex dihydrolipoamide dehydrogenase (E3) component
LFDYKTGIDQSESRMTEILRPDLCVVGAGAGGVAAAYAAAVAGASVAVVEARQFDESSPRPELIMHVLVDLARTLAARRMESLLGPPREFSFDWATLRARVGDVSARIAFDSPARLAALNIDLIRGKARFTSAKRLETVEAVIEAKWFIVAPGAMPPLMPRIEGLEFVRALRLESLVELDARPDRVVLIGGSAHGLALAQALHRLGAQVHLCEAGTFLPDEDRELLVPVLNRLRRDGVVLHDETVIEHIEPDAVGFHVDARRRGGETLRIAASHLMVTAPPVPLTEGLGLTEARVRYDKAGIKVDAELRTTNPRIYAIGDVLGGVQSYANARFQAERVVAQIFEGKRRAVLPAPRLVFTDPQFAAIGLTEAAAQKTHRNIRILRAPYHDNVAAQIAGETEGHVKIVTDSYGRLLGAGMVTPHARELIGIFGLALGQRLHANDLNGFLAACPSFTETARAAALASPSQLGKALWGRIFPVPRRYY